MNGGGILHAITFRNLRFAALKKFKSLKEVGGGATYLPTNIIELFKMMVV